MVSLLNDEGGKGGVHSLQATLERAHYLSAIFRLALVALVFSLLGTSERITSFLATSVALAFLRARDACF